MTDSFHSPSPPQPWRALLRQGPNTNHGPLGRGRRCAAEKVNWGSVCKLGVSVHFLSFSRKFFASKVDTEQVKTVFRQGRLRRESGTTRRSSLHCVFDGHCRADCASGLAHPSWRAMLRRRPNFRCEAPYASCRFQATMSGEKKIHRLNALLQEDQSDKGGSAASVGRHGGLPSIAFSMGTAAPIARAASRIVPGGRCSVGAQTSGAKRRVCAAGSKPRWAARRRSID